MITPFFGEFMGTLVVILLGEGGERGGDAEAELCAGRGVDGDCGGVGGLRCSAGW